MLKREFPRPNGFLATVRDLVLSANVYAALVTRAGIQWRGASTRPAAEAFLIFAAALHTTLDNYREFLDWFRETFVPLIQVVEEMYGITDSNPETYAPALDILAQIKTIQLQWRVWNGNPEDEGPLPASASLQKLIWNASTSAGKELATLAGATISPVIRLAENTIRASTPKWFRARKLKRAKSQRRVSSILDSRPSLVSRALLNPEALTGIPHPPAFAGPASNYASRPPPHATATPISPLSASSNGPYPFRYTVTTRPKETAPNPAPLMLPRTPNSGFRNIWTE